MMVITDAEGTVLIADATIEETYNDTARVSKHPLEVGTTLADHVRVPPSELECTLNFTDSPLDQSTVEGRSVTAYEQVLAWLTGRKALEVQAKNRNYSDMIVTQLEWGVRAEQAATIQVSFEQILTVTSRRTLIPPERVEPESADRSIETEEGGSQTADPPSAAEAAAATANIASQNASVAHQVFIGGEGTVLGSLGDTATQILNVVGL